jgi:hypothetical protein
LSAPDAWFPYGELPSTPLDLGTIYAFGGGSRAPGERVALGIEETIKERIPLVARSVLVQPDTVLGWHRELRPSTSRVERRANWMARHHC